MICRNLIPYWQFALLFTIPFFKNSLTMNERQNETVITCTENIVRKYMKPQSLIFQLNSDLLFTFPVVRYDPTEHLHMFNVRRPDAYIISVHSNLEMLEIFFMDIIHTNPRGKFIFISNKISRNLLKMLRYFYVYKAVLIEKGKTDLIPLYNYDPYHDNHLSIIGSCSQEGFLERHELFRYNLPSNWSQHELTVLYVHYPPYVTYVNSTDYEGIEINLINIVLSHLDVKVSYVKSNFNYWGDIENENFTDAWGELKSRKFDFAIGLFHLKFDEFLYFDGTAPYLQDGVRVIAPTAKARKDSPTTLLRALETKVWIMYFLSLMTFFLVFYIIPKCYNNFNNVAGIMDNIMLIIQLVVETSGRYRGSIKYARFFMALFIFCIFYMNSAFKSKLLLLFSEKKLERQIKTLEDIVESGIGIGFHPYFNDSFKNNESHVEKYIYENSFPCPFGWSCVDRVAKGDIVTMQAVGALKYLVPKYYVDDEGQILIYITDTVIRHFPGQAFFVKGFPLFPRINKYLTILNENGFVEYHYRRIDFENIITLQKATYRNSRLIKKSLNIKKLLGVFYFYLVGILASVSVFLIEILLFYIR